MRLSNTLMKRLLTLTGLQNKNDFNSVRYLYMKVVSCQSFDFAQDGELVEPLFFCNPDLSGLTTDF